MDEWTAAPEVDEAYRTIATLEDPRAIIAEVASLTRRMRRDWGDVMRIVLATAPLDESAAATLQLATERCRGGLRGTAFCQRLRMCAMDTPHPPTPRPKQQIRPVVQRVLDGMTALPAIVLNGRLDLLAANRLGVALYSPVYADPSRPVNLERFAFLNPQATALYPNWDDAANTTVAMLRTEAGRNPYDRGLSDLIGELSTRSEHFVLTGADLSYWERKRDASYHFAEGAPTAAARHYILSQWDPWEPVLTALREALDELGLLEAAEELDLRNPLHDYFDPLFSTGWQVTQLRTTDPGSPDDPEAHR